MNRFVEVIENHVFHYHLLSNINSAIILDNSCTRAHTRLAPPNKPKKNNLGSLKATYY